MPETFRPPAPPDKLDGFKKRRRFRLYFRAALALAAISAAIRLYVALG